MGSNTIASFPWLITPAMSLAVQKSGSFYVTCCAKIGGFCKRHKSWGGNEVRASSCSSTYSDCTNVFCPIGNWLFRVYIMVLQMMKREGLAYPPPRRGDNKRTICIQVVELSLRSSRQSSYYTKLHHLQRFGPIWTFFRQFLQQSIHQIVADTDCLDLCKLSSMTCIHTVYHSLQTENPGCSEILTNIIRNINIP